MAIASLNGFKLIIRLVSGLLYILGALLYALRVPERWFPGKFDIWVSIFSYLMINSYFYQSIPSTVSVTSNFPCACYSGRICALPWHLGNGYVSCYCRRMYRANRAYNFLNNLAITKIQSSHTITCMHSQKNICTTSTTLEDRSAVLTMQPF